MNAEEEKGFLEEMIAKTECALRCAITAIDQTSSPASDAACAKAVLNLVKARAALAAEYTMMTAMNINQEEEGSHEHPMQTDVL